jgi:hypothetical protein
MPHSQSKNRDKNSEKTAAAEKSKQALKKAAPLQRAAFR